MRTTLQKGFTLVELLVVVAIIGLLAGIATVSVNSTRVRARDARRIADVKQMQNALELYNNANSGVYPVAVATVLGGVGATTISSGGGISGAVVGDAFLNVVPKDPAATQNYTYIACGTVAVVGPPAVAGKNCLAYAIAFTTEASTSLGVAGKYCATPTGISLGPNQNKDSATGDCTSTSQT